GGLSALTVLHHHRVLSQALQRAVKWRLLTQNPASAAEPPKPVKKEFRVLDGNETAALLEAAKGLRLYAPVMLAVTTGLRRGEVVGLKWSDIDLKEPALRVRRAIGQVNGKISVKPPKTEKSRRTVVLLNQTVRDLKRHLLQQKKARLQLGPTYNKDDWVFPTQLGEVWKPDSLTSAFRKFVARTGSGPLRFQDLRHTHATLLLRDGIYVKVVSERLGHASVAVTLDTYAHVLPGMQGEAAARLDAIMANALAQLHH
ncbi:MAG: site-specific integrase, partial [Gammaproteobacteria bacterium]